MGADLNILIISGILLFAFIALIFAYRQKQVDDRKTRQEERNKCPHLIPKITTPDGWGVKVRITKGYDNDEVLTIENINPTVGAKWCSLTYSHNDEAFKEIYPGNFIDNYNFIDKTFDFLPMRKISISCMMCFSQVGSYLVRIRFRPERTSYNIDWSGLKYWWCTEFRIKSHMEKDNIGNKWYWKRVGKIKTKKDGKVNGKT